MPEDRILCLKFSANPLKFSLAGETDPKITKKAEQVQLLENFKQI